MEVVAKEGVGPTAPSLIDSPGRAKIAVASLIQSFNPSAASTTSPTPSPGRASSPVRQLGQEVDSINQDSVNKPSAMLKLLSPRPAPHYTPPAPSPRSGPTPLGGSSSSEDGKNASVASSVEPLLASPRKTERPRSRSGGPPGASASPLVAPGDDEKKNESEAGARTKADAGSPRSVGGKEWEWKRKALAGKGIVRESAAGDGEQRVKLPLASLLNTIETDRVLVSSKSDTWKTKALTGRGLIPSPDTFTSSSSSTSSPSSFSPPPPSSPPTAISTLSAPMPSLMSPRQPIPSGSASQSLAAVALKSSAGDGHDNTAEASDGSAGERKSGSSGRKSGKLPTSEKRSSRKEVNKNKNRVTAEVSLPTTVVNRVHVDKDNLVQDMDGVLRTLHDELERLGNHEPAQPQQSTRGGAFRRHRRSKSIDQLASHQTLKPELKGSPPQASNSDHKGSKADAPAFAFPLISQDKHVSKLHTNGGAPAAGIVKPQVGGEPRKTKTNSLRQQLLLGKGVVKPQDKRTVPVSRLSVLIDMADMQAIHQQASVLEAAARAKHSSPSPALLSNDYQPTKEDLVRQRLKTVKAVIASAMDELEFELLHQRNSAHSASGEDQLLVLATKLDQLNDLL